MIAKKELTINDKQLTNNKTVLRYHTGEVR